MNFDIENDHREELQLSILAPVRFQEEFESLGLPASSGVLLAGPPGMHLFDLNLSPLIVMKMPLNN